MLVCASALLLAGCENDDRLIKEYTEKKVMVEEAREIESYLSQDGKLKAKLKSPLMYRVMADTMYLEFPNSLHCDFYDDSTTIETWLDAKYGKYFENQHKVYLRDSVVVINRKGDTLRAPELWWDQNTKLFYTDKPSVYHGVHQKIYGDKGLVATQDLTSVTFNKITGTVKVPEGGLPQ
jgi:LPS export ABC transporter protein LptC